MLNDPAYAGIILRYESEYILQYGNQHEGRGRS